MRINKYKNNGFTITELLISTAVFSVVVMVISSMTIQIARMYYKGINLTKTQTTTRNILSTFSSPIQFENEQITQVDLVNNGGLTQKYFCVGTTGYTYVEGLRVDSGATSYNEVSKTIPHVLWQSNNSSVAECIDNAKNNVNLADKNISVNGRDLIFDKMWLKELTINEVTDKNNLWYIKVNVLFGDRDLMLPADNMNAPPESCRGGIAGSQWCAQSYYETYIYKRVY
jgi:prepilin-type N-terminal cleavage/methylation domain-containing protein